MVNVRGVDLMVPGIGLEPIRSLPPRDFKSNANPCQIAFSGESYPYNSEISLNRDAASRACTPNIGLAV